MFSRIGHKNWSQINSGAPDDVRQLRNIAKQSSYGSYPIEIDCNFS